MKVAVTGAEMPCSHIKHMEEKLKDRGIVMAGIYSQVTEDQINDLCKKTGKSREEVVSLIQSISDRPTFTGTQLKAERMMIEFKPLPFEQKPKHRPKGHQRPYKFHP